MDPSLGFSQLLGLAQGNQKESTPRYLKTEFKVNKKEKKENKKLSAGVAKFLENKEKEERQKKIEEKLKLQRLNELRDDRTKNKIAKQLKVIKSANKAVLDEAVDTVHTAVTRNGRTQCDEDDYGYESKASGGIYEKLMSKFEANPDDPMAKFSKAQPKTFKDLAGAKERVKASLREEEENPMIPGKKRRKKKSEYERERDSVNDESVDRAKDRYAAEMSKREDQLRKDRDGSKKISSKEREKEEARKRRLQMNAKKMPPTMDFQSLMQMANVKKDIPVQIEKKSTKKLDSEFGERPMTKQEKEEYIRENKSRLIKEGKIAKSPPREKKKSNAPSWDDHVSKQMVKSNSPVPSSKPKVPRNEPGPMFHTAVKKSMPPPSEKRRDELERERVERERKEIEEKMKELQEKKEEMERKHNEMEKNEKRRQEDRKRKIQEENDRRRAEFEMREEQRKRKELKEKQSSREKKELDSMQAQYKEMQRKMKEMESKLNGGASSSKGPRDPSTVQSRAFPGEKRKKDSRDDRRGGGKNEYKRRIESDSEDEYDSEMDDFIDDTDAKVDISAEIRNIFGYDKRRYKDEDFDDRSMENNKFSSIMMEEARSARIGRQEDLEDMRREEEENRRKMMKKRR